MRVMITNDDGIDAPGLQALTRAVGAVEAVESLLVVAPNSEYSGSGTAIGSVHVHGKVPYERRSIAGVTRAEAWAVGGSPALTVLIAAQGGFGAAPDVVLSGINYGANMGRGVMHSGTVGAALTAGSVGITGLALSLHIQGRLHRDPDGTTRHIADEPDWDGAAAVAAQLLPWLATEPPGCVVNCNIPSDPRNVRGVRHAHPSRENSYTPTFEHHEDEQHLKVEYRRGDIEHHPESDVALINEGFVTMTQLDGWAIGNLRSLPQLFVTNPLESNPS